MADFFYHVLHKLGYTHPVHPPITHLPVGLIIGGLIFSLGAIIFKRPPLAQTARYCFILALLFLPVAALAGIADWQHFYGGAWLFPVIMKLILTAILLVLLGITVWCTTRKSSETKNPLVLYFLCAVAVSGIGFFGGELVYGNKTKPGLPDNELALEGAAFFQERCAMCHNSDSIETKIGPGLKGLFQREKLPVSERPVSEDNVRRQLKTPAAAMPSFADLKKEKVSALVAYLKTL
ncbi:MAG: c-type cytochrome [Desulfobacterales bacterium]|nr:c-type cytochrome [Desulfobacterales bacterium]